MATVIRFSRHGTKKRPYFRVVVQDGRKPRDGRFIEHIGSFNPVKGEDSFQIEKDRLEYWLSCGAQLSDSVKNRLRPFLRRTVPVQEGPPVPTPKPKKAAAEREV